MAKDSKRTGRYRWHAFSHWLNLGFLAASGVAAVALGPLALIPALALEAGAMWVVPDLPRFRRGLDQRLNMKELLEERAYYLEQLWGLRPTGERSPGARVASLFGEAIEDDFDDRLVNLDVNAAEYLKLRRIVAKLRELRELRDVDLREHDFERLELVINGYLRLRLACRALTDAISGLDETRLRRELVEIDRQLEDQDQTKLRAVLTERRRLCEARLERLPKLVATLELYKTRSDTIVDQMRNVQSQVLADPGMNVTAHLGEMVERHEILSDPLGMLEAEHLLEDMLDPSEAMRRKAAAAAQAAASVGTKR